MRNNYTGKRFTDAQLKGMNPASKLYKRYEAGGQGLGIRVEPTGTKTFFLEYRSPVDGCRRDVTIGRFIGKSSPAIKMSLATARLRAELAKEKIRNGVDPSLERKKIKLSDRDAFTVEELTTEYLEKHAKPNKRSWRKDKQMIERDIIPAWGNIKAKDIVRRDIVLLLDDIMARNAPCMANRILSLISGIFSFAVKRDILMASPCVGIDKRHQEMPRERVLTENEIMKFWRGLDESSMNERLQLALMLVLVTAQRKGEVATAEWSEVDLESGWWIIPPEKTKNKKRHRVSLSPLALKLFKSAKRLARSSKWVFPSPKPSRAGEHIGEEGISRAVKANLDIFDVDPFTPHDLRRTAATQISILGTPRLVIEKILNHSDGGVTAIYDRNSYDKEKKEAMKQWAGKLASIISGKKETEAIVEFTRSKQTL
jgi:integrase